MAEKEQEPKKPGDKAKEKISKTIESIKANERLKKVQSYARENTADTIAYIILTLGIIVSVFSPLVGGAIIGAIVGIYFADDIVRTFGNLKEFIRKKGKLKSFIILGVLIALFIALPALFVVAAAAVGIKQLVDPSK